MCPAVTLKAATALLLSALHAAAQTFYWHGNPIISNDRSLNRSYNWSATSAGHGPRPVSVADDAFTSDALAPAWTAIDLDNYAGSGSHSLTAHADQLTLSARGTDVFGTLNEFYAVHRGDILGDFDVTVKVVSQTNTHDKAKAGIMMANDFSSLGSGGYAYLTMTPGGGGGVEFGVDINTTIGQIDTWSATATGLGYPIWLRMVRAGSGVRAYYKTAENNGWTQVGTAQTPQALNASRSRIGLFASSHNAAATLEAVFDDFEGGGNIAPGTSYDLSFNGTGSGADANSILMADLSAAGIDFTGYTGTADFGRFNGLAATLYDNNDFTGASVQRVDTEVNFDWGSGSPDANIQYSDFSIRWEGLVQPQYSETYTFHVEADDGERLWVGNTLVIDAWNTGATETSGSIVLAAGVKVPIRLEYYNGASPAKCILRWSSASVAKAVVPASALFAGKLMVGGDATFSPGMTVVASAGSRLEFNGSGAQTFTPKYGASLPGIVKSGSGTLTVATHPLSTAEPFEILAGTWDWGASGLTHSVGRVLASGGTLTFGANTLQVAGDVDLGSLGTLNPHTGGLHFTGGGPQVFTPKGGATHPHITQNGAGSTTVTANHLITGGATVTAGTFDISSNARTLAVTGNLLVNGGTLAAANGGLDVDGDVNLHSGALACPSGSFTVGGSITHSAGTWSHGSGTVTLDGTVPGRTLDLVGTLNHLSVNGTGGVWILMSDLAAAGAVTLTAGTLDATTQARTLAAGSLVVNGGTLAADGGSLDINGDVTATSGTLSCPSGGFSIEGSFSKAAGASLNHNNGTITLDGAAVGRSVDVAGSLHSLVVGGAGGEWTVTNNGLLLENLLTLAAGTLKLGALTSTVGSVSSTGGALDFGGGTLVVSAGHVNLNGLATLTPGGGTLSFPAVSGYQILTPKSGSSHPHITHTGAGELELAGHDLSCLSFSQSGGILDFGGRNIATTSGGDFTISNGNASTLIGLAGRTLTVAGNATLVGASSAGRLNLDPGAAWYLNVSGSAAVSLASVQNANSTGYSTTACSNCANLGTNSNWTFATTWDGGGADANWSTAGNWGSDQVPSSSDAVIFDAGSLGAVLDEDAIVRSLTMTSGYTGSLDFGSSTLSITGDADLRSGGGIIANTGTLAFTGVGAQTFIPKSWATLPHIVQDGSGGATTLTTNALIAGNLTLTSGTFHLGAGLTHTVAAVSGTGGLDFGTSNLKATGNVSLGSAAVAATSANTLAFTGSSAQTYVPASDPDLNLTQNGAGGTTVATYDFTTPALTILAGTFNLGTGRSHAAGTFSGTGGGLAFGSSTLSLTGATLDFSGLGTLSAGTGALAFSGASPQTFTPNSAHTYPAVVQSGGGGTILAANNLTAGALSIANGTFDLGSGLSHSVASIATSAGGLVFNNSTLKVTTGSAVFSGLATLAAGTGTLEFTAATGTQSVEAKEATTHPQIVHSGAGTLRLLNAGMTAMSFLQSAGSFDFNNYNFTTVGSGNFTVNNGNSGSILNAGGRILTVAGDLSLNGAASTDRLALDPTFAWYLRVTGTASVQLATVRFADAAGYSSVACTHCANSGDNLNWTFATAWDGGGGDGYWTTAANWTGDHVPTASDDVLFDATSLNATLDASATVKSITFTSGYTGSFILSSNTLTINAGNADFRSGGSFGIGSVAFTSSTPQTFIPKASFNYSSITQNGTGGTTILTNSLNANHLDLTAGTLNLGSGLTHWVHDVSGPGGLDFGSSNLIVQGDADLASATVTASSGNTLIFYGPYAKTYTPNASVTSLNLTQDASGSTTVMTHNFSTPTLTISNGTLNLGTGLSHAATNFTATGGGLDFGSSTLSLTGATLDFSTLSTLAAGTGTLAFTGASPQTFTPKAATTHPAITQSGTGGTTLTANALAGGALTLSAGTFALGSGFNHSVGSIAASGGGLDFGGSTLQVGGHADLSGLATLTAGSGSLAFTAASGTQMFTPKSGANHPAILHDHAGTLQLAANALACASFSQSAGVLDLNGVNLTTVSSGDFALANGTSSSLAGLSGRTLTVAGNASLSGAASASRLNLNPGAAWTLAVAGTLTASLASLDFSHASASAGTCSNCANQGNNSNWTFAVSWDGGGADNNWSTAANWGSDHVPSSLDAVIFDATSVKNATLDAAASVKAITFTTGYTGAFDFSSNTLTINTGHADFRSGGDITAGTGALAFTSTTAQTFIPKAGATFPAITQSGAGGTTLSTHALFAGDLAISSGSFNLGNGMTHTFAGLSGSGSLDFGTSNASATGNVDLSGLTVAASSSNTLAFSGGSAQTFTPNTSVTALNLTQDGAGGTTVATYDFTAPILTIAAGTFNLGAGRTHILTATPSFTGGVLHFNSSTLRVSATTVDLRNLTGLTAGTGTLEFTGPSAQDFYPKAAVAHPNLLQSGTGGTTLHANAVQGGTLTLSAGTLDLGSGFTHSLVAINSSGGGLSFNNSTLQVAAGNADLSGLAALTAGTGTLQFSAASGTQVFTPKASTTHPAISHAGAGILQLATHPLVCAAFTQSAGTLDLNGLDLTTVSSGDFTITGGTASSISGLGGRTLTVAGNASLTGTSGSLLNLDPGTAWTLAVTGTLTASLATLTSCNASVSPGTAVNTSDGGGNTHWSFAITWSGAGNDDNWSTAANWTGGAVPGSTIDVIFDGTGTKNAVLDAAGSVKSIVFGTGYTGAFNFGSATLTVAGGNADFRSGGAIMPGTGTLAFTSATAQALIPKGGATFPNLVQNGAGGTTITSNALTAGNLTLTSGAFILGAGFTHTLASVSGSGSLDFGTSNLNATGNVNLGSATVTATTASTLAFTGNSAQTYTPNASVTALNLSQNGSGGTTVANNDITTSTLTIASGTLALGTGRTHTAATLAVTGGGLDFGSSTLKAASHADLGALAVLTAGTGSLELTGGAGQTVIPKAGATHPSLTRNGSGTAAVAAQGWSGGSLGLVAGALNLGAGLAHAFTGIAASGGTLEFGGSAVDVSGNADFSGAAVTAGTGSLAFSATSGTQVFTPAAGAAFPAVSHTGAGALQLASNDLICAAFSQSAGTLDLNGRNLTTVSGGDFTLTDGASNSLVGLAGRTITVAGNASIAGSAGNLVNLNPGSAWTLAVTGALAVDLAQVAFCHASASEGEATASVDGGGNTNWSFSVTWDGGGADDNWNTAGNWSSDAAPTASTRVIFDATSFKNCVLDGAVTVKAVTFGTGYTGTFSFATNTLNVSGDVDFRSGGPITAGTGTLAFAGSAAQTFLPKAATPFPNITQNGAGGTTVGAHALTAGNLTLTQGSFNLGSGFNHAFASIGGTGGGLDFGGSNLMVSGHADLSGLAAVTAGTGRLEFTGAGSQTFTPKAGATHPRLAKTGPGATTWAGSVATGSLRVSAGTLSLGAALTHDVADTLICTGGALDFGSSTLRVGAVAPSLAGLAALIAGTGTLEFTGAMAQAFTPRSGTVHPAIVQSGAGGTLIAGHPLVAGNLAISNGIFDLGDNAFLHAFTGVSATGGGLDFGTSTLETDGNVNLGGLGSLTAATGTLSFQAATGTQSFTPKSSALHPLILHTASGTLALSANPLACLGFLQSAGVLDLGGVDLTVSGTGSLLVSGEANPIANLGGRTLTVGGDARFAGTWANRMNLDPATAWTLAVTGSLRASNVRLMNSAASISSGEADSSVNLGLNTGWAFLDSIKPDNVTAFLATATGGNTVALSWTASSSADADSVMLRYRTDGVYPASRTDGALWRSVEAGRTADTATGLPDKTLYHFAAFVKDSSGNYNPDAMAAQDTARTPDITPPANVTALVATGITSTTAAMAWTPSGTSDADTVMIRYRIGLVHPEGPADGLLWKKWPVARDKDTVIGLAGNTIHAFSLFVRDSSGNYSPGVAAARDTSLFQSPVTGTVVVRDSDGFTRDSDPALDFTWSGADSLRFSLEADTALAAWKGLRTPDSLDVGNGDGPRIFAVQFKNIFGRRSPWFRDTTRVDRAAPEVTLDLKDTLGRWTWPASVSGMARDSIAGNRMAFVIRQRLSDGFHFNGSAWQAGPDTAKVVMTASDTAFHALMPAASMAAGDYRFSAFAEDRAGNLGAPVTRTVRYEENRIPALAFADLPDTLRQNDSGAYRLDFGDMDAGDSLAPVSFDAPAWLVAAPGSDTAWAPWARHKTYALSGTPRQAHVGGNTVQVRLQDRGGLILAWSKTVFVVDVNDAPIFNDSQAFHSVKEDSVTRWQPKFKDEDPGDTHTLALLSGPAFARVESLSVVFSPGSRDVGVHPVTLSVSDGRVLDTLHTSLTVINVNDPPYAFPSAGWRNPFFFREDQVDTFSVVVVDLDRNEPVVVASPIPAYMKSSMTIDSSGYNRTFRFTVAPGQKDTGSLNLSLVFKDIANAVTRLDLVGRVLPTNDTPAAVVTNPRVHGGAARFDLAVEDEDGSLEKARFHYRLVGPAGDTLRRGITPSALLSLHPLSDGDYRLAVRAEDQDGLQQAGYTVASFSITGATTLALDSARWHMLGPQQATLPASIFGDDATLATWDEAGDDGQPLARYASGKTVESLKRGKGYWVRLAQPMTLIAARKDLLEGPASLRLTRAKQGWNQVANPYPYWIDVTASRLTFWEWDAERRDLVNSRGLLKPWAAYWVMAPRDTTLHLADAPYFPANVGALAKTGGAAGLGAASFRSRKEWSVLLALRAGNFHDQANILGVRRHADSPVEEPPGGISVGANPEDGSEAISFRPVAGSVPHALPAAPKFGDYVALHFEKPASGPSPVSPAEEAQGYATDYRTRLDPEEEWWDFSIVNAGTGETVGLLTPSGLEGLAAAGLNVFLVKQGEARLVEPGETVALALEGPKTHYSLVVTPHADFASRLKGNFAISQNFPNPVTTLTSFRFVLPHSWDREGKRMAKDFRLRINLYDYAGRKVAQAVSGTFRPGTHTVTWKPARASGGPLAQGPYLYRLETPGFVKTMKMVVE